MNPRWLWLIKHSYHFPSLALLIFGIGGCGPVIHSQADEAKKYFILGGVVLSIPVAGLSQNVREGGESNPLRSSSVLVGLLWENSRLQLRSLTKSCFVSTDDRCDDRDLELFISEPPVKSDRRELSEDAIDSGKVTLKATSAGLVFSANKNWNVRPQIDFVGVKNPQEVEGFCRLNQSLSFFPFNDNSKSPFELIADYGTWCRISKTLTSPNVTATIYFSPRLLSEHAKLTERIYGIISEFATD